MLAGDPWAVIGWLGPPPDRLRPSPRQLRLDDQPSLVLRRTAALRSLVRSWDAPIMRAYFRRRTLPWFLLAAVLAVVGLAVLHGIAEAVVFVVAAGVMLGAAIRYVGLAVRDDPVSASVLSRDGLIGGVTSGISSMSAGESAAKRRHDDDEP